MLFFRFAFFKTRLKEIQVDIAIVKRLELLAHKKFIDIKRSIG